MKQTKYVGCGLSIKLGYILIVLLISFSLVMADGNTTTTETTTTTTTNSTTTTIDGNTTTTVNTTTTIDGNTTTTTVTTTTIEENETNETSTYISVEYESEIEEGETSLIKVTFTWDNGTVEGASGTIEYDGEAYDLEFEDSTETYDYLFSETEGSYDFYVEISKEGFEPQYFNGTIEVEPAETTTTTSITTTTSTTTTSIDDYSTSLIVNVPSSVYSNESAEFKINYTTESGPVTDADVILEISHEEINLITNESYVYSEAYFVPWSSSGFYYYSLDLEIGLYNYSISASKDGLGSQEYKGDMVVKAVEEENEEPKGEEYFIDFEDTAKHDKDDSITTNALKAGLPIEETGYSELTIIFILFGFMCAQVAVIVFVLYRNMKKEEEMMRFLLIMMMLNDSNGEGFFGDFL